jgi:hypothetical protein
MHIEILVEDSSGERLLEAVLPKLIGDFGEPHTWNMHSYKGIGRIPKNLKGTIDPQKRILLDQLPRILQGYGKTPGVDAVVVVLDLDQRNCIDVLEELNALVRGCNPAPKTMFRLAIEEVEAWYLGDQTALIEAYPSAKLDVLSRYQQDSVCGTWELLADAIYPGGSASIKRVGWPLPGQVKHEWAEKIAPLLDPDRNRSDSFKKLRDGLRRLIAEEALNAGAGDPLKIS